jgi:hypothetical protein
MRAETAAQFVDELSVNRFLEKVKRGEYPPPIKRKGSKPKWHRYKLEQALARKHGIRSEPIEDVLELI